MHIAEMFRPEKTLLSLEVFPPKPDIPIDTVFSTLDRLRDLNPDFISVTYGAGGSQCQRTIEIAAKLKADYGQEALAHLTCVGAAACNIDEILTRLHEANIENILALRGDPPLGQPDFTPAPGGFAYAGELVRHISAAEKFSIGAAAYPEGHPECRNIDTDIHYLKHKVEQGAGFLITQLCFDNSVILHWLERIKAHGIHVPVSIGIMPVLNAAQIKRITSLCGAAIPGPLARLLNRYGASPAEMEKAGIAYACGQITDLVRQGVDGIHFYSMNKAAQTEVIIRGTGLR